MRTISIRKQINAKPASKNVSYEKPLLFLPCILVKRDTHDLYDLLFIAGLSEISAARPHHSQSTI